MTLEDFKHKLFETDDFKRVIVYNKGLEYEHREDLGYSPTKIFEAVEELLNAKGE